MRARSVPGFRRRGTAGVLVASGLAVVAVALLLAPVEIPDRVSGMARVLPAQEWVLVRTASGAVTATLRDHRTGAVSTTFAAEPARGDAVRFELGDVASRETIERGDPVGFVASGEAALRLSAVRGEIERAQAELTLAQAGTQAPLVEAARTDEQTAAAALAQAETTAARQRQLLEGGLTSAREAEQAESAVRVAEARVAAAQARTRAVATGPLPEEAEVVRARIRALEREARSLTQREALGTLSSPITGRVHRVFSPDTLLLVTDTSAYHVLMPVRWSDGDRVTAGRTVRLTTSRGEALARVVDVREAAAPRSGQAYLVATAEVTSGAEWLAPGLLVPASVEADPKTPLDHVQTALSDLFSW